jgi:hypothetical protein
MTGGAILYEEHNGKGVRVRSRYPNGDPATVLDVKSGFSGTVDYDGATVLSNDDENGWRLVPLRAGNGRWALLVWKMDGEFDDYRGLRAL